MTVVSLGLAAMCGAAWLAYAVYSRRNTGTGSGGAAGISAVAVPAHPTFTRDVAPILFNHCAACHFPDGAGPFSLLDYSEARKRARQIAEVTARRYMPPWLPEAGVRRFEGEEQRRLSEAQIQTLRRWAEQGADQGDAKDLPPTPDWLAGSLSVWRLGTPDLVVEAPEAYTLAAEGADVYRNFVIPAPVQETRYVRAVEFQPGSPRVVHHAFVLLDRTNSSRVLDRRDAGPGFEGMRIGEGAASPGGHFLSWQPGASPAAEDERAAWPLTPGSDLVFQLHMRPSGKPQPVKPRVGLYFTDKPPTIFPMKLSLRSTAMDIPAGATDYAVEARYVLPVDVQVLGVLPHAHYLGKDLRGWATLPDGSEQPLIRIPQWDFNWQGSYRYAEPLKLPKGTALRMRYTYDNSASNPRNPNRPPRRVTFGPQTTDEMGELWIKVLPADLASRQVLQKDYYQNWVLPDAVARFRNLLKLSPADASLHADLANALGMAGQSAEARTVATRALELNPNLASAHYTMGVLHASADDRPAARAEFQAAVRLDPNDFRSHTNLGAMLVDEGHLDAAQRHYQAALNANADDAQAHVNLGLLAVRKENYTDARGHFENALKLDPTHAAAAQSLEQVRRLLLTPR